MIVKYLYVRNKMEHTYSFSWDWKEQPNWRQIFKAVQDLNEQDLTAYHYEIKTGSDEYGLLISANNGLTDKQAYDEWVRLEYDC